MASVSVQPLPASRRQQPGYREQRRKKVEEYLSRKMSNLRPSVPDTRPEIRSPLMERSNHILQKKSEQIKPMEQKTVKPVSKENVRQVVNKDSKNMTIGKSFLKTKTLKVKELKDEKVKLESAEEEPKQSVKPVLGAYRGKIIQSKINSFRDTSEKTSGKSLTVESKTTMNKRAENRPKTATVPQKPAIKATLASDVRQKRAAVPPVSSQSRPSTSVVVKSKSEPETVRRPTQVTNQKKPVGVNIQQRPQPVKTVPKNGPTRSVPEMQNKKSVPTRPAVTVPSNQKNKPVPQPTTTNKYSRPNVSAAERKAHLAEWRASKGKVMKRPPLSVLIPSTYKVKIEDPELKLEPEEPKEETRQLYWATMAEEDEQEFFTLRVHQIFGDCQKLIDEATIAYWTSTKSCLSRDLAHRNTFSVTDWNTQGCPKEEVLSILEKQIQKVPEAKKLSRYWECLALLEQRDGQLYKVIAICEEAVAAGAQPLEELRTILADVLEQLKADSEEKMKKESEESKVELKSEETALKEKKNRRRGRALKPEPESPSTSERTTSGSQLTPEDRYPTSSVIRFNIRSTPHLEKMKKLQNKGDSSGIKSYKFLTPVRRSSRLERKSHTFPDMLRDHDPCVTALAQLEDLEDPETCTNAYIFRKNSALKEMTAKSAKKK